MKNNNSKIEAATALPIYFPVLLISLLLVILTSCVLSPIYTQIENDVTVMYTVIPAILNYLIIIFETLYISLLFAAVSYSMYAVQKNEDNKTVNLIFVVAIIFLKHILNLAASSIIDRYIDITFDIPVTIMLFCADLLTVLIVRLIAKHKCQKHYRHAIKMQKASKYLNTVEYDEEAEIYPFKGFLDIKNPILFSIFVGSLISVSALLIQRLYADIFVLGTPETIFEVAEIMISYLADILLGIIGYTAAYFSASFIFLRKSLDKANNSK